MSQTINLGSVTAYASAVEGGYTGTYADFCAATANVAEVGELQADTMPTASADRVGQVIQYTGATSNDYTHGYFYECVDNSGTYSWQNVSVQVDQAGHTIVDSTGTNMTQRNKLKFIGGAAVTDDSTNNQTIVDVSSKVDETNISLVQTTLTATKNYAVNDPFIYDGQLYKADSAISNGGTIVISGSGQNASTTTVEELLSLKVTASGGESGNTIVTFTDASADAAITSGDTLKSIVAKVKYKLANLSGGHTILNSSGTAMAQRGKLQFVGADVVDDSANDKTIVTGTPQSMIGDAWILGHAYAVGDYCIDGNVLYKCKTAHTSSASYRPPYASYWNAVSVASQLKNSETVIYDSGNITSSSWTEQSEYNRYIITTSTTAAIRTAISQHKGFNRLYMRYLLITSNGTSSALMPVYLADEVLSSSPKGSIQSSIILSAFAVIIFQYSLNDSNSFCHIVLSGDDRATWKSYTYRLQLIGID